MKTGDKVYHLKGIYFRWTKPQFVTIIKIKTTDHGKKIIYFEYDFRGHLNRSEDYSENFYGTEKEALHSQAEKAEALAKIYRDKIASL